ncbi:DNA methyltransferase [Pseudomonas sp. F1_0610]|uniref:DNA methyltransferase n=1 Tax=Pseudomonas sp. F1_0610 TaxID=3114284 RepID=UPI0039C3C302
MNSYLILDQEDPNYKVPADIVANDELNCIDVGWMEQMLPFIDEFTHEGQSVLDPFAGLGTTLVAATKLNRHAIGIEISAQRCDSIQQRINDLQRKHLLPHNLSYQLIAKDALYALQTWQLAPVQLVLSNIPYFSINTTDSSNTLLYKQANYQSYLDYIDQTFAALHKQTVGGGTIVCMIENTHNLKGELLPLAWDIAQRLAKHFTLFDERILLYPKTKRRTTHSLQTHRQHEYVLIGKKYLSTAQKEIAQHLINKLQKSTLSFSVIGSFATSQHIGDVDLAIPLDASNTLAIINLLAKSFPLKVWSWNELLDMNAPKNWNSLFSRHYLRLVLDLGNHGNLQIDLSFTKALIENLEQN